MDVKEKQKLMILCGIFGIAAVMLYYNLLLKPQFLSFRMHNREYFSVRQYPKRLKLCPIRVFLHSIPPKQHFYDITEIRYSDLRFRPNYSNINTMIEAKKF